MKAKVSDPLILHPEHESAYAVYNVQIMVCNRLGNSFMRFPVACFISI